MKNTLLTIFAALCVMLCMNVAEAQVVNYEPHVTLDELQVDYRWQRERVFAKNSNAVLNLQLTNLSDSHINVHFVVAYYRDGQLFFESEENVICLRPDQRLRGGRAGLRFVADGILLEDVGKETFDWDILISEIHEVSDCE